MENAAVVHYGPPAAAAGLWLMPILQPKGNPIYLPMIPNAGEMWS
jgi:hypothetical protein